MSGSVAVAASLARSRSSDLLLKTAVRNIGRNRRRTWLTAGSIGFAVFLITVAISLQDGGYDDMRENATALMTGHLQIVHESYPDNSSFEFTVGGVSALVEEIKSRPGVREVFARVQAFALVSVGERSYGAQILGVNVTEESRSLRLIDTLQEGRAPETRDQAALGSALARNLAAEVGDELVILGSGKEGGVAALALTISGIFQTGIQDIDRAMIIAPYEAVQEGFGLQDEAHVVVVQGDGPLSSIRLRDAVAPLLDGEVVARPWQDIMPEVEQSIELDRVSGNFMYGIVMILVGFSVVNTFIMVMFERTREFGMLLALGMKPWSIIGMVQLEALGLWIYGLLFGWLAATPLVAYFVFQGISLGEAMDEMAQQMYMPTTMYGGIGVRMAITAPLFMLVATQIAALLPSLRLRKLNPVEALRPES